jgi:N-methylhydantoinase B
MKLGAIELSLFSHRLTAICEEMGAALKQSAISPNIKDREDYSCALFDREGELVAQAAHIPVHLGSMAYCMRDVVSSFAWQDGDVVVFNDPFLGGTHLPDITVVTPCFIDGELEGFAAARAHHADIGGKTPGSMGVETRLSDEGFVISPSYWYKSGAENNDFINLFRSSVRNSDEGLGDLSAQLAACRIGMRQLSGLKGSLPLRKAFAELLNISEAYGRQAVASIPDGIYSFEDALEGDGINNEALPIRVTVKILGDEVVVDFSGSAKQCDGPVNCPISVTAAAVYYVFRCLMPRETPQTSAIFRSIQIVTEKGSVVDANPGAAVAAGNVETSQRIVDVVLGALAKAVPEQIPAAAQGTMNNVIFGVKEGGWVYYETLAGGMGAHANGDGLSAVQCHMTNTKNTSIEVLEMHYPLRVREYSIRTGSGGAGRYSGGSGIVREWELLEPCHLSLISERRAAGPYGLHGGGEGKAGKNLLKRDGAWIKLDGKCVIDMQAGDILRIETPGGGGFGAIEDGSE